MNSPHPDPVELSALLRLLDDDTPEVRAGITGRLSDYGGDLSELLPEAAPLLGDSEKTILAEILRPARRQTLRDDWQVPGSGQAGMVDDWDFFESQLRVLSDFLHDGVSLRQPLSDALDLLSEDAREAGCTTADDLRVFLFEEKRLRPNSNHYYDPRNSDLAWCLDQGLSNPIGLGTIFMLVGKRMDMEIEGLSFPGHFLCRIYEEGVALVVDCFDRGKVHCQDTLTDAGNDLSEEQIRALQGSADLGTILVRVLNNLIDSFQRLEQVEDAKLIMELRDAMQS